MSYTVQFHAISDMGCVRKNNEDMAYAIGQFVRDGAAEGTVAVLHEVPVAFAVADGMGGYEGGEVASEIVCRAFADFMKDFRPVDESEEIEGLKSWAKETNALVLESASLRPELSEMGTTFVALVFVGSKAWLVNIGDSRCYRFRQGILKQLSVDHSERERTGDPDVPSNLIYNFMGNFPDDFISDITSLEPIPGDLYLLCSDGLSDMLSYDEIDENISSPTDLIQKAKEAGGRDNVTLVSLSLIPS